MKNVSLTLITTINLIKLNSRPKQQGIHIRNVELLHNSTTHTQIHSREPAEIHWKPLQHPPCHLFGLIEEAIRLEHFKDYESIENQCGK